MSDLLLKCTVCQSLLDEEDLFCANCGTEAPPRPDMPAPPAARAATYNFQCNGCGASMSYDAKQQQLRCPFCGSVQLEAMPDAKILAPRRVVPFVVGQPAAIEAMRTSLRQGFFRPGDLSEQAAVVNMQPVYVPYWVFAATTYTHWTADTNRTPASARGDWFPLSGEHRGRYENLLIGASGALTPAETAALCPFDLAEGVPPEQVDLENITVEQFSVQRKYARPLAHQMIEQLESNECCGRYVPGRARNVRVNVRVEGMTSEPMLLPVWIMAYHYRERLFRFLVNGQTGKASGERPISWWRVALIPAAIILVILLALLFAGVIAAIAELGAAPSHCPTPSRQASVAEQAVGPPCVEPGCLLYSVLPPGTEGATSHFTCPPP
jgi:DNA-directed RNA polymerase subunit RPC12/RpoP